jgi:hypothetical protein
VTVAGIVALACAAPLVPVLATTAASYRRAARARGVRRDECPFENDDDAVRPFVRELADVVRESIAVVRAHLPAGGTRAAWRTLAVRAGGGPIVMLLPDAGASAGSLARFGRRFEQDLDASIHLEAAASSRGVEARADCAVEQAQTLARSARGRVLLLVGHGAGGLVARRVAGVLALPQVRLLLLATPHRAHADDDTRDPIVERTEVVNVYSLHDATIVPAERAYLPGAYNVALRDHGHFGLLYHPQPYVVATESFTDLSSQAAAS